MQCRICSCDVAPGAAVACGRCSAPFHGDCWEFNGGCGIFGCCGTEAAPWAPQAEGALLSIDETTRPPLRLAPLVEKLVRRLPGWGRAHLPPALVGGLGGALMTGLFVWVEVCRMEPEVVAFLVGTGAGVGLLASLVAGAQRRRPAMVAFWALSAAGGVLGAGHYFPGLRLTELWPMYVVFASFLAGLVLASTSLVEVAWRALRLPADRWRVPAFILRCLATTVVFAGLMVGLNWCFGHSRMGFLEVAPLALLGLGAVLPSVALSKSALMNRLKEEARRPDAGPTPGP